MNNCPAHIAPHFAASPQTTFFWSNVIKYDGRCDQKKSHRAELIAPVALGLIIRGSEAMAGQPRSAGCTSVCDLFFFFAGAREDAGRSGEPPSGPRTFTSLLCSGEQIGCDALKFY